MILSIEVDEADRLEMERVLTPTQYKRAMYQAVRRTTRKVARVIRGEVKERAGNVKKKYVDRAIVAKDPVGDVPIGEVRVKYDRIPLVAFKTKVNKRTGVIANVGPGQPPITLRHAFKATVGKGRHQGIFMRGKRLPSKGPNRGRGKLTPRGYAGRFVIIEATGPSILSVVNVPEVIEGITFDAAFEMKKNLASQLDRFLPRDGGRAFPTPILSA